MDMAMDNRLIMMLMAAMHPLFILITNLIASWLEVL